MKLRAEQVARVGPVVLHFLAVAAVLYLLAVQLLKRHGRHHRQGDALVGWPEHHIEVQPEIVVDGLGVVQTQPMQLLAGHIGARVHEERRLAPTLQREIAELQHVALNHELDELALVSLHSRPFIREEFPRLSCAEHDTRFPHPFPQSRRNPLERKARNHFTDTGKMILGKENTVRHHATIPLNLPILLTREHLFE